MYHTETWFFPRGSGREREEGKMEEREEQIIVLVFLTPVLTAQIQLGKVLSMRTKEALASGESPLNSTVLSAKRAGETHHRRGLSHSNPLTEFYFKSCFLEDFSWALP